MEYDDLAKNPGKWGFCSYQEFKKNPDKWRPKKNQLFESVDNGIQERSIKSKVERVKFYMEGYLCESLEKVETLAKEMNVPIDQVKVGGIVKEKVDNGKERLHVHFMSQETINKRKTW